MDKTLLKGLSVLEAIVEQQGEARPLDEIASQVGLTRSNAHRTLQTLMHAGYVERDLEHGGYRGTMKVFALGVRLLGQRDIRKAAPPNMLALAKETGETIHLSLLDGMDVIYIDKIDSDQPIRAYSIVGGRAPVHAVATGKALLSVQSAEWLDTLPRTLPRYTAATIVDLATLKKDLARAVRQGFAINCGEWRDGVGGLAAPVFDGFDRPVAAVGISGPLERLTLVRMRSLAPRVIETAARISAALGHRPSPP